ncbi:S8 family serine peptidase [Desulfotomaculum sp. 1211_IL3151]|uniref:S8 family serine peptidase n=1 Tax=Desulfotomaculum sp. 1211_IL3151 TaxID=3084055 RepID=UPI002FD889F8
MYQTKVAPVTLVNIFVCLILFLFIMLFMPCTQAQAESPDQQASNSVKTDRIIVKFKPGATFKSRTIQGHGLGGVSNTYSIPVHESQNINDLIQLYESKNEVEYVQPDYRRRANNLSQEISSFNWGVARTGVRILSQRVIGNSTAIVAVLDSGVYSDHSLLYGKVLTGYDFVNEDHDPEDPIGHGTQVSGIIAMSTGNQRVRILPVKVLDEDGYGYDSDIVEGIYYAVERGADVINLSLGGEGESPVLEEAVRYAISKGVVVVAAAGNEASDAANFSPANIRECITVSAVNQSDKITYFSNYGSVVDVAAPGENIFSSVPLEGDMDGKLDGYISSNGTSFAAPFVSAITALLRVNDNDLSTSKIEEIIYHYSDDVGIKGKDSSYGYGIVNFTNYKNSYPTKVEQLVNRVYQKGFGRDADEEGLKYWTERLMGISQPITAAGFVDHMFIGAPEFVNKQLSDDELINAYYYTFFNRLPDPEGLEYWKGRLYDISKRAIVAGMLDAGEEFRSVCDNAGIEQGRIENDAADDMPAHPITSINTVMDIVVSVGSASVGLPDKVIVNFDNGRTREKSVFWDTTGLNLNLAGSYVLQGVVEDTTLKVTVKVIVGQQTDELEDISIE